jgi:2-methylisocitrate lyase-like PEP mutase family enzyme
MNAFADLHRGPLPLLLPNAWDVASALAFVAAGYPAIGTTSLGVSASLGVPDGSHGTQQATVDLARSLARLPAFITMDCEDGHSDDPPAVAAYVAELALLGVAGVNLEDSRDGQLVEPSEMTAKVAAVKDAAPDLFVNARVDTYWFHEEQTIEQTLARARAYVEAGADGIFVPGLGDPDTIRAITGGVSAHVNLLPVAGRSLGDLAELGVRRVSTGSLPYRAAISAAVDSAAAVRDGAALPESIPYAEVQELLRAHSEVRSPGS